MGLTVISNDRSHVEFDILWSKKAIFIICFSVSKEIENKKEKWKMIIPIDLLKC